MRHRVITKNNIEVTVMLREVLQHEAGVSYIRLTDKAEVVLNNTKLINQSLTNLTVQVQKYMVDNHIGE